MSKATLHAEPPLPNFLVLGAAKSGTTSLYAYAAQHPDLFFSEPKEPVFFEAEYERGLEYYRRHYFAGYSGEAAVGEARTHNLFLPYVVPRIRESLPDARLVVILRDPVARAYSHWWHRHSRALEPRSLEDAVEENLRRLESGLRFEGEEGERLWRASLFGEPPGTATRYGLYLDLGLYAEQLERYRELFPHERIHVLYFEDLVRDPAAVTQDLWRFLGLSQQPLADAEPRNSAFDRRISPLAARLRRISRRAQLRRLLPAALRERGRALLSGRPLVRPPLGAETERNLRAYFEPHNRALERQLGRTLPDWFKPRATRRPSD